MSIVHMPIVLAGIAGLTCGAMAQEWATFESETGSRMIAASGLGANDPEEKDYAWGDFDQDGDIDLAVARRGPVTSGGPKRDVLFMNEGIAEGHGVNGVLVDRTEEFASASSGEGQGMLDATNDRDIQAVDVNLDGWLDLVTGDTYGSGPKYLTHHRIYINLGEQDGQWLGFMYDIDRIPQLEQAPDACGVTFGDVNDDGAPDLYFVTYNSTFEDHILINHQVGGEWGHFVDQSASRLSPGFRDSGFGSNCILIDMNGDGDLDIVKSENGPVDIAYNDGTGNFQQWENIGNASNATYHVTVGNVNNDGMMDLIASNDGQDLYHLNQGAGGDGMANFGNSTFSYQGSSDDGFASNSLTADLNNDGFNDILIADVDVDVAGCGRRMHIFRNLGNLPNPTLQEQASGGSVVGISTSQLTGMHDMAVFDLNGDGWPEIITGRCNGTAVWVNQPPIGVQFTYPNGLPIFVDPDTGNDLDVNIAPVGNAVVDPGTVQMYVSVEGEGFSAYPATPMGADVFRATFPAVDCTQGLEFYFEVELTTGETFTDPPAAPLSAYSAISAFGTDVLINDDVEEDVSGWIIVDGSGGIGVGLWEQAEPNPTIFNGNLAAPEEDGTFGHEAVKAFVTANGLPEDVNNPSVSDVDGGPFHLISPAIDLGGQDANVSYDRWFVTAGGGQFLDDYLTVDISNDDGASWVPVPEHTTQSTSFEWETVTLRVGDYVEPTSQVRLRFTTADEPNNSVTEAGIDDLIIDRLDCGDIVTCPTDLNGDNATNVEDLVLLILAWGTDDPAADITGDGVVGVEDLIELILAWGDC